MEPLSIKAVRKSGVGLRQACNGKTSRSLSARTAHPPRKAPINFSARPGAQANEAVTGISPNQNKRPTLDQRPAASPYRIERTTARATNATANQLPGGVLHTIFFWKSPTINRARQTAAHAWPRTMEKVIVNTVASKAAKARSSGDRPMDNLNMGNKISASRRQMQYLPAINK